KLPLGRLSTVAARLLIGKDKTTQTPHVDSGDYVIVINASKLKITGNKMRDKIFYRHSGYPGGLYKRSLADQTKRNPTKVIMRSVRGMLPVNKLRPARLKRLKVYAGSEHNHSGQKPIDYFNKEVK
ncbi:50S ribosomal protein L13, partial [Candidatus Saccharibacteria bacterium RIFCSPLOWO2_02_FULL_46_7]